MTNTPRPENSASPSVPSPEGAEAGPRALQLGNPPLREPLVDSGHSQQRAAQEAQRAVASRSLDAPSIAASTEQLPYEALRQAQVAVETRSVPGEAAESRGSGDVLLERARQGQQVEPYDGALTRSHDGLVDECELVQGRVRTLGAKHEDTLAQLRGEQTTPDGASHPGLVVAPDAEDPKGALVRLEAMHLALVLVPGIVEGSVVFFNMRKYMRADDLDVIGPLGVAVVIVSMITALPFALGRVLNGVVHGAPFGLGKRVFLAVGALFWVGAGSTLAAVRVQVDRMEAIRSAEEQRRSALAMAQQLDPTAELPPIDPAAVFDPVLPTILWVAVLVGFGVLLMIVEAFFFNPVQVQELKLRRALRAAERQLLLLREQQGRVAGSVALQRSMNASTETMWTAEPAVRQARGLRDIATYRMELGIASGDPEVPLALERHDAEVARRRGSAPSAGSAEDPGNDAGEGAGS